jgi:hypothetical protein
MIPWLIGYLLLGAGVAYGNDSLVLRDHTGGFERFNYALRTMLAWPTYLLEDFHLLLSDFGDDGEK